MRLPFDPGKMAAEPVSAPRSTAGPLTVTELAARIGESLAAGFPVPVRVIGEVTGFKPGQNWYFSLKDANSVITCVMFGTQTRFASFLPANGQEVVATGRPDFWAKGGRASLVISKIEPVGQGALDAAFRALCEELRKLGWFEPARKRPIPRFPRRVAVVTSKAGAAIKDVLVTMRRRCPAVEVAVIDVAVQGDGAAADVARAIRALGMTHRRFGIDVILVTRGGGSREDLWAFNERIVAEAIVGSPIPVVAAIGHEADVTIAELVADERAATPTQAAMKLTPDTPALLEQLSASASFLRAAMSRLVRERRSRWTSSLRHLAAVGPGPARAAGRRLEAMTGRLERQRPAAVYERRRARLEAAASALQGAMRRRLAGFDLDGIAAALVRAGAEATRKRAERATAVERRLEAVGPMAVLRRGYSVTTREDGVAVRSPADIRPGQRVQTRVAGGTFGSIVAPAHDPPRPPPAAPAPARPPPPDTRGDQMDLFAGGR